MISSNMLRLLLHLTVVLHLTTCGSAELCQGDNQCSLCTVTGPTVMDIQGRVNSVPDRCAYSLMKTASIPGLQVHATFQERRRKDVSFLDRVILFLEKQNLHIILEQGGKVASAQVGGKPTELDATTDLEVHGVKISKDQTGVTAKMSHLKYTMTVFFDGYTAQIHIKGPSGQAPTVEGLCADSTKPFSEVKLSADSKTGCDTKQEDAADSTIDCKKETERCNLLKEAPFTACHSNVDPEPYVAACTKTLCAYPATDGLNCQFLEAYARACSLHSSDSLDAWRSKADCSAAPQAFCQDRFCSAHEFCGENSNGGGTRCHCRAIFASPYRSQNTFGDPLVSGVTNQSVTLVGCLLEEKGISYSDLHLYDRSCRGEMDSVTHNVTFSFDTKTKPCGTLITMNSNRELINKNAIISEATRRELMVLPIPFYIPDFNINFSVKIKVKSGSSNKNSVAYATSGAWNYTLTMKAYTDSDHTQAVLPETQLALNQKVWFELKVHGMDEATEIVLVTHSCFATNEPSPDSDLTYDIIINGCPNPADKTVTMENNGLGASNYFSYNMFQFSGKTGDVYLHCRMNLCEKNISTCAPVCNKDARRRRSTESEYKDEKSAIVGMAWGT